MPLRRSARRRLRSTRLNSREVLFRITLSRTTLLGADESEIREFYVNKLGFRVVRQVVSQDGTETQFLLEMGKMQVEIRCAKRAEALSQQFLTITAKNLEKIRDRLVKNGIEPSELTSDAYTGVRSLSFSGPDGICVTVLEQP